MDNKNHSIFRLILAGSIASLLFANIHHKMNAAKIGCESCVQDDMDRELDEALDAEYQDKKNEASDEDSEDNENEEFDHEDSDNEYEHDNEDDQDEEEYEN